MFLRKQRAEPHAEQHRRDERDGDDRGDEERAHGHASADTYTLCMPKSSPRPRTSTSVRGTADPRSITTLAAEKSESGPLRSAAARSPPQSSGPASSSNFSATGRRSMIT